MATPAIRLQGVLKRFGKKTAVRDLDLEVPTGTIYGLIGPNGAGKTTSIRMMLDIIGPDSGTIELFGSPDIETGRERVGYLPEERGLYQKMTVLEHLAFFGELKGMRRKDALREARTGLEEVGLAERTDDKIETLSKGMAQKVQFLGTILHRPDLLVLDEPFSGLDPLNVDLFKRIVLERQRQGATILFSTHLIEDAERLCERVCMIAGATKVLDGKTSDVKASTGRREVAISFEGDGSFLEAPGLVERVADHGQYVEVRMVEDGDPQDLLERAVRAGTRISRFELVEPSLREIFIEKAEEAGLSAEDESEDASEEEAA
ncbi:MAG: ATP-binding cassette domain-containing protein [Gemmatimonadetes bacterium]|nr:ATP-binding cassette domain-containing protein [Gemmatimonadota bacterium]